DHRIFAVEHEIGRAEPACLTAGAERAVVAHLVGVDTDRRGALIKNHKVFLSVGHDEYWSAQQRANVETARGAGVHLAFFSGNEVYWKTRWEPAIDGTNTPYRTLVTYKETSANQRIDPA